MTALRAPPRPRHHGWQPSTGVLGELRGAICGEGRRPGTIPGAVQERLDLDDAEMKDVLGGREVAGGGKTATDLLAEMADERDGGG